MAISECLCGNIKVEISGPPVAAQAVCHCSDCRKISGSAFGFNWVVSQNAVKITGEPKTFKTTANSGNLVTSHFCGNCGVNLWRDGPATKGLMYLKAGTLSDHKDQNTPHPVAEIFVSRRLNWVSAVPNAGQKMEME
ncbi:uncharacterized protein CTRU02_212382 [Colletotrichum truncatum]|uniref:Uncharacterized protein n=1 Tax=Colletotrichum truncatum TaxID=5467 RepID=A0ACC3YNE1_COLTU|nr:uncharacterized protein CTRU02_08745 [Colletotrichum truncatum]KAF6789498.1 hypothetical protein CTRU02_08745 [Colletotrichum truncatum]